MCAIFGFISRNGPPRLETLRDIVRANINRGPHAFGFAWLDRHGRLRSYKQTGRITDDLGVLSIARDARLLIGHLRWATHGDAANNLNNHPHPADGGWLVHNGIVANHVNLSRTHDLWPVSECDSEVLGLLIERGDGAVAERTAAAVRLTHGPLALLGLWPRPGKLIAARRGNPLHVSTAAEGAYLATLAGGLPGRPVELPENTVVRFSRSAGRIARRDIKLPRDRGPRPQSYRQSLLYCGG